MSSNQFKTRQFQKLKEKWYKKLAKSGFEDIEDTNSPKEYLKTWHAHDFRAKPVSTILERESYYASARAALHTLTFSTHLEAQVWECFAEGLTLDSTAEKLSKGKRNKISRDVVFSILKKLKKQWLSK